MRHILIANKKKFCFIIGHSETFKILYCKVSKYLPFQNVLLNMPSIRHCPDRIFAILHLVDFGLTFRSIVDRILGMDSLAEVTGIKNNWMNWHVFFRTPEIWEIWPHTLSSSCGFEWMAIGCHEIGNGFLSSDGGRNPARKLWLLIKVRSRGLLLTCIFSPEYKPSDGSNRLYLCRSVLPNVYNWSEPFGDNVPRPPDHL